MKLSDGSKLFTTLMVCAIVVFINLAAFRIVPVFSDKIDKSVMGGDMGSDIYDEPKNIKEDYIKPDDLYIERFLRPSGSKVLEKKYPYGSSDSGNQKFSKSSEVVRAYFDILSDASNMDSKKGGCGSIGFGKSPYNAVYKLLSEAFKKTMPYDRFVKSFDGIGHINLIKMVDAPAVKSDGVVYPNFLIEIETIEGSDTAGKTYFGYYYGYITASQQGADGWKIQSIELKPEDFLCHAYHGWWHDAGTMVDAAYIKGNGIIEKILGIEEDGFYRNVIAKGKDGEQYRLVFVRLTNGADIELKHYVMTDGKWKDIRLNAPEKNK